MKKDRVKVSDELFSSLLQRIFTFYIGKLAEIKIKEKDIRMIKKIRSLNPQEFFNPPHGYKKHIFAKKHEPQYYCSVGSIIVHELEKSSEKPEADLSDYIYKRCLEYKRENRTIEVFYIFLKILNYPDFEAYCKDNNFDFEKHVKEKHNNATAISSEELKLEDKLKGGWWLYFYKNEGFGKDPSLASAILEVKNLKSLKIFNSETESSINYDGQIDDSLVKISGVVYFKFKPINSKDERNLRIAMHISQDMNLNLALGQYTNIDRGAHLIRGSVCMERKKDYNIGDCEKEKNKLLPNRNFKDIPKEIRRFLADKNLNFNRLPKNQYSLNTFSDWLKVQSIKSNYLIKQRAIENKKLFISCPISSVSAEQFDELRKIVVKMETFFKDGEIGFTDVYSIISGLKSQEDKASIPSVLEYQKVMRMYNDCSYHIAVWPQNLGPSGILFEIGWAVMNKRPVVILEQIVPGSTEQAKSQIPLLLLSACDSKKTAIVKYPFKEFDSILEILDKNKLNIFPGHPYEDDF